MKMSKTGDAYHFFGDLYLDYPGELNRQAAHRLESIKPYFKELESRHGAATNGNPAPSSDWDCQGAFDEAARSEVACWESHGQSRDVRFLIPPDGPLEAPLACHLHNPTFNVSNPYSSSGADDSNMSIDQIMLAGFTPDKVLIYDHTFRREPVDGIAAYPPDVLEVHESFTSELRSHMAAVVDVVWGAHVRQRMKKTHRLEKIQLWGQYRDVSVYLEWEKRGEKLKRFVIFVCHPEAMVYGEPEVMGKQQDLSLQVAARLAKVDIRESFYQHFYRPQDHKFLSGAALARRSMLNKEAMAQVESVAYGSTSSSIPGRQRRNRTPMAERKKLAQYPGLYKYFGKAAEKELKALDEDIGAADTFCEGEKKDGLQPKLHIHPEVDTEFMGPRWLKLLASDLVAGDGRGGGAEPADAMQLCYALADGEFDTPGLAKWGDLPPALRSWLQAQDGLKVDGRPVASLPDLLQIHGLILKKPALGEVGEETSVTKIFVEVLTRYYHLMACSARSSSIDELTVRGSKPVALKCSRCGSRVLDDAFPRFKKSDQQRYVAHHLKYGCGSASCQESRGAALGLPWDNKVPWAAPKAIVLDRRPMKAGWADLLLLQGTATENLPGAVPIICRVRRDEASIQTDEEPRWTIETPPRYVIRKPTCKVCCTNDTTWCTVDPAIRWLDPASISKMWKKKDRGEWDLDDMLKHPGAYFPKAQADRKGRTGRNRTKRTIRYQKGP